MLRRGSVGWKSRDREAMAFDCGLETRTVRVLVCLIDGKPDVLLKRVQVWILGCCMDTEGLFFMEGPGVRRQWVVCNSSAVDFLSSVFGCSRVFREGGVRFDLQTSLVALLVLVDRLLVAKCFGCTRTSWVGKLCEQDLLLESELAFRRMPDEEVAP
jgi:hypothetical protein